MAEMLTINATAAQRLAVNSSRSITQRKTQAVAGVARLIAPGSMKQKIRTVGGSGPSPIGIVVCDHPAAIYVIHGTKAHVITPREKAVLAFTPRGGGNVVFAKIVHHPGTKPNNFLLRALKLGGGR
jgi:hypothetical protein